MTDPDWSKCPEATHFDPVDQNFLREVGEALLLFNIKRGWTVPLHTVYGLRVEDCNRPLIKRPEWNGDGLPPVGVECEWMEGMRPRKWVSTTICGHSTDGAYAAFYHDGAMGWGDDCRFRPAGTNEKIAAEERTRAIDDLVKVTCINRGEAARIYEAGYRKQVAP